MTVGDKSESEKESIRVPSPPYWKKKKKKKEEEVLF